MKIKKWKIFTETLLLTVLVLAAKNFIHQLGFEVFAVTPLHTSVIAGSTFVLGFMLASAHTDYKESERLPGELVTAVEDIYLEGHTLKSQHKDFNVNRLHQILYEILVLFKKDVSKYSKNSLEKTKALSNPFLEMEKLGIPANYIVRLKQHQALIMRSILRVNYIQNIELIPSAFILIESIVVLLIGILIFTRIGDLRDSLAILGFLSFLYIYILKLIRTIERPFHPERTTMDDISLFQIEESYKRMKREKTDRNE